MRSARWRSDEVEVRGEDVLKTARERILGCQAVRGLVNDESVLSVRVKEDADGRQRPSRRASEHGAGSGSDGSRGTRRSRLLLKFQVRRFVQSCARKTEPSRTMHVKEHFGRRILSALEGVLLHLKSGSIRDGLEHKVRALKCTSIHSPVRERPRMVHHLRPPTSAIPFGSRSSWILSSLAASSRISSGIVATSLMTHDGLYAQRSQQSRRLRGRRGPTLGRGWP